MAKRSLSQDLDNKIYNLIQSLLADKTELKKQTPSNEQDPLQNVALAKDLRLLEIFNYCQSADRSLQRVKHQLLESTIDRVLKSVQEEEQLEIKSMGISESEEQEPTEEVAENNMNKSITSLWKQPKKRTKDSTPRPKRPKADRSPPTTSLSSLGGMDQVITELREVVGMPILHPEIYTSTGIQPPRGVLLHGPPGCGKTTIANALAGELQVPFISISAPSVVSGMSGESEKKVREIFDEAKSLAPCLIFFDEIDSITPKRDGGAQREMERRIVAQLLTCMDELCSIDKPVIIIGATNRPDSLDPALRRAGRFDREICINVPGELARFHIMQSMLVGVKTSGEFPLMEIAKMTPGFVGADLKALVTAAGICAIKRIFETMSQNDMNDAMRDDEMRDDENMMKDEMKNDIIRDIAKIDSISTIEKFLQKHPEPLSPQQLEPLSITYTDFVTALPSIQPTAKREGFATVPDVSWSNVGALSRVRVELHMAIVQPIKRPEVYERVGITAPAGVLMWGPPGCGKTLLAKAVANESKANFISIKGPELLNKYVGESERAVRQVFARARASVPCIIFFDELDALVPRRDASLSESSSRVVNTLLTELDGLNDRKGIFVVGATNRPDMIDPAMLRPGRLDKTLYIELPSATERLEILNTVIAVNGTPVHSDVDLPSIAHDERCRNFSGADLSSLVREAGVCALKKKFFQADLQEFSKSDDDVDVTADDFEQALNGVKPSVSDKDRLKYERLNKRMGWSKSEEES